jgi:hypothetical protein
MHVKSQPEVVETQWGVRSKRHAKFVKVEKTENTVILWTGILNRLRISRSGWGVNLPEPHRVLSQQLTGIQSSALGVIHDGWLRRQEHGLLFVFRDARVGLQ